jgi:hypothetical protein
MGLYHVPTLLADSVFGVLPGEVLAKGREQRIISARNAGALSSHEDWWSCARLMASKIFARRSPNPINPQILSGLSHKGAPRPAAVLRRVGDLATTLQG